MSARQRRLVLVDLENLAGCSPARATGPLYCAAVDSLRYLATITDDDLMVLGVNPGLAYLARDAAPGARIVTRNGRDGAELRLIDELTDRPFIASRFSEVVIASGDHKFLDPVVDLNRCGVSTTVAALPGQLATVLRIAARNVIWLPNHYSLDEAA